MKVGVLLPQGLTGEFAGWAAARAWQRTLDTAQRAEALGFESAWVYDHVGTFGTLRDEPTLEAFAVLGAVAASTTRLRLGPLVARAGLRNPALLAKHTSTLDVISGGRVELGLGAGATRAEAETYGYPFPSLADRFALLRDTLAIVRPMLAEGRVTYAGDWARATDALDNPRGVQSPRIPIIVGGNARSAIRLAAEFADEINLDGPSPVATARALDTIRDACVEVGRDPATLAVSVHILPGDIEARVGRVRLLEDYRALGVSRVMALVPGSWDGDEPLDALARDARAAGLVLA